MLVGADPERGQLDTKWIPSRPFHPANKNSGCTGKMAASQEEILDLLAWKEPTSTPPASIYRASLGPSVWDLGYFLQFFLTKELSEDRSCRWAIGIFSEFCYLWRSFSP